jgi:hypothetical protein
MRHSVGDQQDHVQRDVYKCPAFAKFCSMGMVTSAKWFPIYIVVEHRVMKIYDNQDTVKYSPGNTVLEIPLDSKHCSSPWKRKDYSSDADRHADFFCFYMLKESDIPGWGLVRELKIGCAELKVLEDLMRCVEYNTRNKSAPSAFQY